MAMHTSLLITFFFFVLVGLSAARPPPSAAFLKSSCAATTHPRLCYSSLSATTPHVQPNPKSVASGALSVALSATKSASSTAWHLLRDDPGAGRLPPAVADCAILLADACKQLQRSVNAMAPAPGGGGEVGDVQTWASAALTDENTCMEEMVGVRDKSGKVVGLRRQVMEASELTSNALALVNGYGASRKRPRHHHPSHKHSTNHP